jgi:murein L,D-transpeptidase YcbB/YkuD
MTLGTAVIALSLGTPVFADDASSWIRDSLDRARGSYETCTSEGSAIAGTLSRIQNLKLPDTGKVIVVNIASGVVTAYDDGVPVIESKGVVGKDTTPTPELDTHVTFVRPNPTWTVPRSIVKRNDWYGKLRSNPSFFDDNHFELIAGGKVVSPYDVADNPQSVEAFVQKPGAGNALGSIKIGIANDQAIYLHDTNDPGKFDAEVRAASAGCVRIERVRDIAAWAMDISPAEMARLVDSGSTENLTPPEPIKVVLGYWTAWPDSGGRLRFYPDIYSKDGSCSGRASSASSTPSPEEEAVEEPRRLGPRVEAIEDDGQQVQPRPVWTEYQTR